MGTTICVYYDGGPSMDILLWRGREVGNPYPTTLDFDLHLNVLEYGTPGPIST
ncbi:MAG: hypothetical protein R2759_02575 [Bacteroidales bacterium]